MNWLYYIAEANLYLVIFYGVYSLILAKETHYQLNRAYLLASSASAFALPLIQLNFLKPAVYVSNEVFVTATVSAAPLWQSVLYYGYLAGVFLMITMFVWKLIQLKRLARGAERIDAVDHQLIKLKHSNTAFSFFNYLFIGTQNAGEKLIINHELVHIRQKHSADVVFIEILKAINWFNPVVYLLQNSIRTVHEYIADEQTAQAAGNVITYASFLVDHAYGDVTPTITHSFFNQNLLKKRIIMLDQKRSGKLARLKYLVAVPLCAALLTESTLGFSKSYGVIDIGQQKIEIDTAKKTKATGTRLAPPPPKPNVSQVKFPQPAKKSARPVKFPPPVVRSDDKKLPPPPPPTPSASQVKFPLPAKMPARMVKFPPPVVRPNDKKLPPPPPPAPPKKSERIRIEEPVKSQPPTDSANIHIQE